MATSSARKILKTLLSSSPSCDSATTRTPSSSGTAAKAVTADSNSVSDASDVRGVVAMDGLLKYEDLMALLTCSQCQKFCGNSIVQCRKGSSSCVMQCYFVLKDSITRSEMGVSNNFGNIFFFLFKIISVCRKVVLSFFGNILKSRVFF